MLLLHQTGSVKIGEVVRYTVTYAPAHDRILPSPHVLHLKIKNTSAIALRAAFVHGPYTLYAAAYPANFHPNSKFESPRIYGVPEFEPNLKAGGNFTVKLNVPESVRESAGKGMSPVKEGHAEGTVHAEEDTKSVRWIIEVSSQVIFSNSAAVHYEILLGRDEKSLALGFASSLTSTGNGPQSQPGHVSDHQHGAGGPRDGHGHIHAHHSALAKGVFSKSIKVKVDDTASLWNTPRMPEWDDVEDDVAGDARNEGKEGMEKPVVQANARDGEGHRTKRQKRIHLVVLTHGLHSNLGADMLFLKESIDEAAKQAKADARIRKAKKKEGNESAQTVNAGGDPAADTVENHEAESDDEEEVVVRGFSGNAVRTERGIKYLGKRLAKYVLQMTYPDQPYKPVTKKSTVEALSHAIKPDRPSVKTTSKEPGQPTHEHSSIIKAPATENKLAYKITSISFIAHSLGGLVQTYAVAYIQKHSPEFFDKIEPINFISLASPFLGLSNENPMYVKFALDFGLVGRTGQDLGLTWRAPTIARSGWGAIVGGIGDSAQKKIDRESAPESKPLLRILPTGPAHVVLKKFRNRTIYSNVVNDGVVPLRTSCLLFLDWQGLGRVEKARRDNGLVGTMASWGWAELTGANSSAPAGRKLSENYSSDAEETGRNTPTKQGHGGYVPQPSPYAMDDDARSMKSLERSVSAGTRPPSSTSAPSESKGNDGPLASIMKFFQPTAQSAPKPHNDHPKHTMIYKRSQTLQMGSDSSFTPPISKQESSPKKASGKATTGEENGDADRLSAPPKTTFFESAGDIIKPPLPPTEFLIDPSSRPRTIFHDRVYHPEDIPPPPLKKRPTGSMMLRRRSSLQTSDSISPPSPNVPHTDSSLSTHDYDDTRHTNPDKDPRDVIDGSAMKVEEKIARAYHRDISWRKVLVRLEPDAHNNIIVRRMFANAYGWPVVKHLCDTHFADSEAAQTRDEDESNAERAKGEHEKVGKDGGEVNYSPREHNGDGKTPRQLTEADRTESERREATDALPSLPASSKSGSLAKALAGPGGGSLNVPISSRSGPVSSSGYESDTAWSERDWADSEFDSDDPETASSPGGGGDKEKEKGKRSSSGAKHGTEGWNWTEAIAGRGVGPSSPKGTDMAEIDRFLAKGKGKGKEEGTGK